MKDDIRYTEKISRREKDMQEGNVTRKLTYHAKTPHRIPHINLISYKLQKIAKGKILLICHSIKFANKSIELEKRDTKIFDLKDLTASNNLKIRRKEKRNPIRIPIPYGILEPKDTVRITWITNGPKLR
ncbi:hypothetical protein HZU67_05151 [Apis mellifera carnica]|nr:hypothetical protein HZU67_05151 [Apis mellifera carnica]